MKKETKVIRNSTTLSVLQGKKSEEENWELGSNLGTGEPFNSNHNVFEINKIAEKFGNNKRLIPLQLSLEINQLQQEKQDLIDSISILKKSAVSALAEKDDQIEELRQLGLNCQQNYRQLYQEHQSQQEVSQNCSEIQKKYQQERKLFAVELRQKQTNIEQLLNFIEKLRFYIQQLESNEKQYLFDIRELESNIQLLNQQIQQYTLKMAVGEITTDVEQTKINLKESRNSQRQLGLTTANFLQPFEDQNILSNYYKQTIAQLQNQHKQQLQDLSELYEQKIRTLKQQQQNYLQYDGQSVQDFQLQYPQSQYEQSIERSFNRSHSQKEYSKELIPISEMSNLDVISQHSIHNLREQIISPSQFMDAQNLSQFSKTHFDNPFVFFKHKSSVHFEKQTRSHCLRIEDTSTKETLEKDMSVQFNSSEPLSKELLWQKTKMFTTGLISGISLTSLVAFAIRKKK